MENIPKNRVVKRTYKDNSTSLVAVLLGIVTILSIVIEFILIKTQIYLILTVALTVMIYLVIVALVSSSKRRIRVVRHVHKPSPEKNKEKAPEKETPKEEAKYTGSSQNKKYHLSTCRFAKSIKPEYKVSASDVADFKKRKFKKCKTCLK